VSKGSFGTCRLTGTIGPFVKSHIIPAALTRPAYPGGMLFQHGSGRRAQKRRTSWYDQSIVCADGERILSDLDDWGIQYLRSQRLVWSGFGSVTRIDPDVSLSDLGPDLKDYGVRKLIVDEPEMLRRFFLSLLWRASVSRLPEMCEVKLDQSDEDSLTSYIRGDTDLPLTFFPCWLTQHHQVGFTHNHTPVKQTKTFSALETLASESIPIYRFYFDGLVVHFHDVNNESRSTITESEMTVGFGNKLYVTCIPWERSAQLENLVHIARESLW
jgi:hypothetical protein